MALRGFTRGDGPLVAVIYASRGRTSFLNGSIESLLGTAADPAQVEILIKIDDDDEATVHYARQGFWPDSRVKFVVSSRGNGYADMHLWLEDLCCRSNADWYMVFNDDARMLTLGWDTVLSTCQHGKPDDLSLLIPTVVSRPRSREFFAIRREVLAVLGGLGPVPYLDSWLTSMMAFVDRAWDVPIRIEHFIGDFFDQTYQERKETNDRLLPHVSSHKMMWEKVYAMEKLLNHIGERERNAVPQG